MEIAGLAIGIASLYNATLDILGRIDAYRSFGIESQATLLHFEATQIRLEDWADLVGIHNGKLADHHDPRLNDPKRASIIRDALICLRKAFDKVEYTTSSLKLPIRQLSAGNDILITPYDESRSKNDPRAPLSKRSRIAWAAGGREKLNKDVRIFEGVVNVLYNVVNPNESGTDRHVKYIREPVSDLDVVLERIQESLIALDRREILDWLDALKNDDEYEKHISSHLDGTCKWILHHPAYINWESEANSDTGAKFLWINGPAGFGKTVLSAWLVKHIRETLKLPVAYCFSSSHAQRSIDFDGIVRTWITQLAQNSIDVLNVCQKAQRKQTARRASRSDVWNLLREISAQHPCCVLALDGLDEFVNDARSRFLGDIKKAVASTKVKVIITSRNEVDIESEVSAAATELPKYVMLECKVTKEQVNVDVHLYSQSAVAQKFPRQGESFRQQISTQMAENAGGMFLLIKLQQSQLRGSQNRKTVQRIVQEMPQGLHQTYARDWDGIQGLPAPDRKRAVEILRWLTFGYRALTVQEMAEALIIELDDASEAFCAEDLPDEIDAEYSNNEIKGICGSLVELRVEDGNPNSPKNTVHLVHASVREYLINVLPVPNIFGSNLEQDLKLAAHHAMLATHCLRFLNCGNVWDEIDEGGSRSFLPYAVEFWLWHHDYSQGLHEFLFDALQDFMKPENANFMEWRTRYEITTLAGWVNPGPQVNPSAMYYASLCGSLPLMDFLHSKEDEDMDSLGGLFATALQAVCVTGNELAFDRLMGWGANATVEGGRFDTAITAAACNGRYRMVKAFLDRDPLTDLLIAQRCEAIKAAAAQGHVDITTLLLEHLVVAAEEDGHDCDLSKSLSVSLRVSAENGHTTVVKSLLEHGADIAARNEHEDTALHLAAANGHTTVVKILLEHGADIAACNEDKDTPLHLAASHGGLEIVVELTERGANTVLCGKLGASPLHFAAYNGFTDNVVFLLANGAEIDAQDESGLTALYLAIYKSHRQIIDLLLEHGADVTVGNNGGWKPIHRAVAEGLIDIVPLLIEKGADLNAQTEEGESPLILAVRASHKNIVEMLLQHEVTIRPDNDGWTPLMCAVARADLDITTQLLHAGADPNIGNEKGWTPLFLSIEPEDEEEKDQQRLQVAELLLHHGAVGSADFKGLTPLHRAACCGDDRIVALLLDRGHDVNVADNERETPLHSATREGHGEIVSLLLDRGHDVNVADKDGWTSLHAAAANGHDKIVALLLDRGHDMNVANNDGWTPLHDAAYRGHERIVSLLLDRGQDVNVINNSGCTSLHGAAESGHDGIVKLLLDRGHNVNDRTDDGRTPLSSAALESRKNIVELLLCRGADANLSMLDGISPIFVALGNRDWDIARSLIARGCYINTKDSFGRTPLRKAIEYASDELIEDLIQRGADPLAMDSLGMTCLNWVKRLRPHLLKLKYIADVEDNIDAGPDVAYLRRTIYEITTRLRHGEHREPDLYHLCKGLFMLDMELDAKLAYQAWFMVEVSHPNYVIPCTGCENVQGRVEPTYTCRICPEVDFCQECMNKHEHQPVLDLCKDHKFLKIVPADAKIQPDQKEAFDEWLLSIQEQVQSLGDSEMTDEDSRISIGSTPETQVKTAST